MISKTKINKRIIRKKNPELVKTIILAKKNSHIKLAAKLSSSTRKLLRINLDQINKINEKNILIPGKVLGEGNVNKKYNISALSFSKQAEEKLKKSGCILIHIKKELENNPELKGVNIFYGKNNN